MPREGAVSASPLDVLVARIPAVWRTALLQVALAWAALFAWFASDWANMAGHWWNSSTYNHILLVPGIIIWLVWLRAKDLMRLAPEAWWPGLFLVAGTLFLWLLGALSGLNLARHLAAVASLQAVTICLLGPRVAAGLLFPLGYMLFLVPFGDEMVPLLQMITAKLTIGLVNISGIPAVIEGVFIDTPVGLFEVAEECSGVKFLIAMVALATLIAQICFRSWTRRIAFLAVAIILPILANGVRAWGTIYIAQSQGVEFAAGFDHIFYGWIFFALVMAALLAIGWRFFDRSPDDLSIDVSRIQNSNVLKTASRMCMNGWASLGVIAALILAVSIWFLRIDALAAELPADVALPEVAGWQQQEYAPEIWWEPRATGAEHRIIGRYRNPEGRTIDVFVALYSAQGEGRDAAGFGQGALVPDTEWRWLQPGPAIENGRSDRLLAEGRVQRLAITYYRTGQLLSGSNLQLKLASMRDRLLMRANPTMVLILSAEESETYSASSSIAAFTSVTGPVPQWMDGIAQLP